MRSWIVSSEGATGDVFASETVQAVLRHNGLGSVEAVYRRCGRGRQRHRGRTVWEETLRRGDGSPLRVFVKLHWGRRRLWLRMNELRSGQMFQSMPVREWQGLHRLRELGLNVAQPLALYRSGLWSIRDAVVLSAVPASCSVHELIRSGRWAELPPEQRRSILEAMVSALRRIHAAGLGWRGASSKHIYPERTGDGAWRVWLIDCEGIHGGARRTTFARDFRKLQDSMRQSGAVGVRIAERG